VIYQKRNNIEDLTLKIQPKNLAIIKPKKIDLKSADDDDYLKIINVVNRRKKQDSFVNRIKQFGIITGNSSKYAAEAKLKEMSKDSEFEDETARRGSDKGNEPAINEAAPIVAKEVEHPIEAPKNAFISAMMRASNAESNKSAVVLPNNTGRRRQGILFDKRTLNPSNPMSKSASGGQKSTVNIEELSKSANFIEWRSICKTTYDVYKKLYKYKMSTTSSTSRLLGGSTAGASSPTVAGASTILEDESEKLKATR